MIVDEDVLSNVKRVDVYVSLKTSKRLTK